MKPRTLIPAAAVAVLIVGNPVVAAPTVYIPLGTANEILVVDASTDTPIRSIDGVVNPHGLAVTPDGKTLVAGSNKEAAPGAVAAPPKPEGLSEEEHRSHHPPAAGQAPVDGITAGKSHVDIIDAGTGRILRRIDVTGAVHHVAITPDGRYAITTHTTAGGVSVIDIRAQKLDRTIATGPFPNYAAATSDGKRVYVSNAGNNTVSEIDTGHWIVSRNFVVGSVPEHIVLSGDNDTLYVNNVNEGTVSVIGLGAETKATRIDVGKEPHGIELSSDGATLFVSAKADDKLVSVNLADGSRRELTLAPAPYHVTRIAGTGKLYVSSREEPKVWVVDADRLVILSVIPVRGEGHEMAVVP
jgi:YVTN family beta-propeller protein